MTTRPKANIPDAVRADVLAAQQCRYCADLLGPFEIDHIRPLSRGGTNDRANLACACVSCNTQKSNHLLHEWMQWRTANGMTWPPIASHPTQPEHYRSNCARCRDNRHNPAFTMTPPHRLEPATTSYGHPAYLSHHACTCGERWRIWTVIDPGYYTDCPCTYCTTRRLEATA